jgi:hypothetical protein
MAKKLKIKGVINGETFWWHETSWTSNESDADRLTPSECERRLRIINANNRFLDREDQVNAYSVESK